WRHRSSGRSAWRASCPTPSAPSRNPPRAELEPRRARAPGELEPEVHGFRRTTGSGSIGGPRTAELEPEVHGFRRTTGSGSAWGWSTGARPPSAGDEGGGFGGVVRVVVLLRSMRWGQVDR